MTGAISRLGAGLILAVAEIVLLCRFPRLVKRFYLRLGYWPRLAGPRSFREKIHWRKIFDRNPLFVRLQDKLISKMAVADVAPDQRMPAVLWSSDDPEQFRLDELPQRFVVKTNHGSGFNVMVYDRAQADRDALVARARHFFARQYGHKKLEWAYEGIAPRLYVEEMLKTANGDPPDEYKVTVMNGRPVLITAVRLEGKRRAYAYFTPDWKRLPVTIGDGSKAGTIDRPRCLDHMLATAAAVGRLVDMVRIDFYDVDGVDFFGECKIYSVSGLLPIDPRTYDFAWGREWDITGSYFFSGPLPWPLRPYRWALRTRLAG